MNMDYMLKVLDLEKELERLKIKDSDYAKHIDCKKRIKELDEFSRTVVNSGIAYYHKEDLLKRASEYKAVIRKYEHTKHKSNNILWTILSFILGSVFAVGGIKLKEHYDRYKNKRIEKLINMVYDKLKGVESDAQI
jgi:hypothetical protein